MRSPTSPVSPSSGSASGVDGGVGGGGVEGVSGGDGGKGKAKEDRKSEEIVGVKVVSPELRALLSRKVEVLSRKTVRKTGEGRSSLKR